jgi:hypothetical protein
MFFSQLNIFQVRRLTIIFLLTLLSACGGGSAPAEEPIPPPVEEPTPPPVEEPTPPPVEEPTPPPVEEPNVVTEIPVNQIAHAFFRDQDSTIGNLSGSITIEATNIIDTDPARTESVWLYWADAQGNKQGDAWLKTDSSHVYNVEIPTGTNLPENIQALVLYPNNSVGEALQGTLISFHDFTGNSVLSGLGGNENVSWEYGVERPKIAIQRSNQQGGLCIFDNGLVSVTNMNNTIDDNWETNSSSMQGNEVNDNAFPAYSFLCDEQPIHNADQIADEIGVWTYSTLNDAMFYGTVVYDSFVKYLGEPPLAEKIRLRVHYGSLGNQSAFWDGAYASFGDAYPSYYSMASLDSIAHEVGHGVLSRIANLNLFENELSTDIRTLHEAFSDISGVMAKYEFTGSTDNWIHGAENEGLTRQLNKIKTEEEAIESFLDYDDAGDNFYLRIGMITYPFYTLSNNWGLEPTYNVYLSAAKQCWNISTTLTSAAECIKQQAGLAGLPEQDVIDAFKQVKIKLFDEGVLSHYHAEQFKLRTQFNDNSQTTNQITQWLWDFGDGQTSTQSSPEYTFAESGTYQVTLTVTDQSNDQDTFTRTISVTDQYCIIKSLETDNQITNVLIDGVDINFDPTKSDYTQNPIELTDPNAVAINIEGNSASTPRSTTWMIWIDLNDNGVFGDESNEIITDVFVPDGSAYAFNTILNLSTLPNDGNAKNMRIVGDYALFGPCSASTGEAFDLKINW